MMELGRAATESEAPIERRGPCGECYMFCPVRKHAIRLEPGAFLAPLVFEEECIGCGMCDDACEHDLEPSMREVVSHRDCSNCLECVHACDEQGSLTLALHNPFRRASA